MGFPVGIIANDLILTLWSHSWFSCITGRCYRTSEAFRYRASNSLINLTLFKEMLRFSQARERESMTWNSLANSKTVGLNHTHPNATVSNQRKQVPIVQAWRGLTVLTIAGLEIYVVPSYPSIDILHLNPMEAVCAQSNPNFYLTSSSV